MVPKNTTKPAVKLSKYHGLLVLVGQWCVIIGSSLFPVSAAVCCLWKKSFHVVIFPAFAIVVLPCRLTGAFNLRAM